MSSSSEPELSAASALFAALQSGNQEEFEIILTTTTPDEISIQRDRWDQTLLTLAVQMHDHEAAETLINFGVNVSVPGSGGETALMIAASQGDLLITQFLLSAGADVDAVNHEGNGALMCAITSCSVEIVRALLQVSVKSVNICTCKGLPPLLYTTQRYMELMGRFLYTSMDHEPIVVEFVQLLIDAGANLDAQNETGETALMFSVVSTAIVRRLVAAGASLDVRNHEGLTALAYAVGRRYIETVRILLDSGANPNTAETVTGETPLMRALALRRLDIADLLTSRGASVNAADSKGDTALMREVSLCRDDDYGTWLSATSGQYAHRPDLSKIEWLLQSEASVNARSLTGQTALMKAASRDDFRSALVVSLLLKFGADPQLRDLQGNTALSEAVESLDKNSWLEQHYCVAELVRFLLPLDSVVREKSRLLLSNSSPRNPLSLEYYVRLAELTSSNESGQPTAGSHSV
eukprot:Gregarina_sp_Poly_1__4537@NODE_2436_length_2140_cov_43_605885_g1547_i0_p1_GENE_NODE_2436_length_2140_cov_43_605885_g1547_i0NODE_2436_length_2140_cov_43_605885_g1547_i0_p1_ORF_typecomplete_len466_score60_38Ank_4/PF13637_6/4_3e03Ank_4/PF13637_6/1_1e08Ank_4/PF13637_6/3_3e13Ank_4/PF13637_6/1e05Ank_4/PF13637_6/2_1e06Ank_4/PF13637_6/0_00042Ank_4/PF13637_6/4_1e08Ank_4/PF13637_6/3_9e05Ank_4/PF13637_6/0_00071Ank_2/PF12796_7/0_012Ank_2/PF12796_7/2e16Ank_2/PF12796_7/7_8e16Ank_2/PF12796_7/4_8e06Ank_2/PF1279